MLEFQLFRVKVYPSRQGLLFEESRSRSQILKEAIASLPSAELRKGMIWHVGNVSCLDESGLYFRVGRTTRSTMEVYKDGNFLEEEFETAPYTHVLLDISLEVCAIARKTRLAPTVKGIANQLARLLNGSEEAHRQAATFEITGIDDPTEFVDHIRKAFSVSKFWVTFSKPNAFDVNKDFTEPVQKLLNEAEGEKGKTELQGLNLKSDVIEDIARCAASTGNDACAWLQPQENDTIVKKRLKGNPVVLKEEDVGDEEQRKGLLGRIRECYQGVRRRFFGTPDESEQ